MSDSDDEIDFLSSPESECDSSELNAEQNNESTRSNSTIFPRPFRQLFFFMLVWQAAFKVSNAAIGRLMRYLKYFCVALVTAFNCVQLKTPSSEFAVTKESMRKILTITIHDFTQFVACPTCDTIYHPDVQSKRTVYTYCVLLQTLPKSSTPQQKEALWNTTNENI